MNKRQPHGDCCHDGQKHTHQHKPQEEHDHDHDHGGPGWRSHWDLLAAMLILAIMLTLEYGFHTVFTSFVNLVIYGIAWLLSGWRVLDLAFRKLKRGDVFNEFVLMSVATLGAFYIGAYSEGVGVMVFYCIGEWFQDAAVNKAKGNIRALLDIRPDTVSVTRDGQVLEVHPSEVKPGEIIQVKPGEKVALDGTLVSPKATFNTASLTGESKPDTKAGGEQVLAGMVNLQLLAEIKVTALFKDSKLSRILEMVQDATARKSQTQLFISRFARIYTPIVFFLALAVCLVPFFFVDDYVFNQWFYRALVFLVISCPCALVVSIPLGYFGGVGLASRNGILFKGGNFLDVVTRVNMVVMDKTGTLTKGVFKVQQVVAANADEKELVRMAATLEANSTHPVARAVTAYAGGNISGKADKIEEIAGHGLKGMAEGREVLAGNARLLKKFSVSYPAAIDAIAQTLVLVAIDGVYAGYLVIADEMKEDAAQAIKQLHALNIKTVMLSGDKQGVVTDVAGQLGIDRAFGDLLPEGKVEKVQELRDQGYRIAFAGDGVNDAPVIALADAGIAMGGLGSDAAIETADIVIQNDQPSKIVSAIKIGKITRTIVWQNIILAMGIKVLVLVLGASGVANLWEAVIADVGVALLAILNAVRIQGKKPGG
ncbi:heavy metal translocating P-type ATPase [Hufsiella ginkgonis]|uniref:P-type Zn(2+) transporter n=1 Tax=Hufsiella ginkgonis TaxID=2695274 RepID=A0A7K1XU95_9SPHI|nr:heavy metal translocating P-type ATPase [Hufsiella ginkgonis]MXV14552.1 cadmium-translocating P-type ATPase [Hufsiella ginkgonis]